MPLIELTGRRLEGGGEHENIAEVRAVDASGATLFIRAADLIRWLECNINVAVVYTRNRQRRFIVGVHRNPAGVRSLRTYSMVGWWDHLLALPDYERGAHHALSPAPSANVPQLLRADEPEGS